MLCWEGSWYKRDGKAKRSARAHDLARPLVLPPPSVNVWLSELNENSLETRTTVRDDRNLEW